MYNNRRTLNEYYGQLQNSLISPMPLSNHVTAQRSTSSGGYTDPCGSSNPIYTSGTSTSKTNPRKILEKCIPVVDAKQDPSKLDTFQTELDIRQAFAEKVRGTMYNCKPQSRMSIKSEEATLRKDLHTEAEKKDLNTLQAELDIRQAFAEKVRGTMYNCKPQSRMSIKSEEATLRKHLHTEAVKKDLNTFQAELDIRQAFAEKVRGTMYNCKPQSRMSIKSEEATLRKHLHTEAVKKDLNTFQAEPDFKQVFSEKIGETMYYYTPQTRMYIKSEEATLRKDLLTEAVKKDLSIPKKVRNYHSVFPLESTFDLPLQEPTLFQFVTSCYKAINYKDGISRCLRRIHGLHRVDAKCMTLVEKWKKLQHPNIVQLREFFTSNAFLENSFIFAHDYISGAETLMEKHFPNENKSLASNWNGESVKQNADLLHENLIWTYVIQLSSALECIHSAGLACRVLDLTKILVTDESRLRINGVGVFEVLDNDCSNPRLPACILKYQQEDMISLGKIVLALACNSVAPFEQENMQKAITFVGMNYSSDLYKLIKYLTIPQQKMLKVDILIYFIGSRFYSHPSISTIRDGVKDDQCTEKAENGRLFRILSKLEMLTERSECNTEMDSFDTGDMFLMKLFLDHLLFGVTDAEEPPIDSSHIIQCLKKLDGGMPEKIRLMSRDEQNVFVVSYAELKETFTKSFNKFMSYQEYKDCDVYPTTNCTLRAI